MKKTIELTEAEIMILATLLEDSGNPEGEALREKLLGGSTWENFVRNLNGSWEIHHTGGGCMVATLEVTLKDGKIVSLGVTSECAVLYTFSWLTASDAEREREESFCPNGYFVWQSTHSKDLLGDYLANLLDECGLDEIVSDVQRLMASRFV